jgi:hypothetical protein
MGSVPYGTIDPAIDGTSAEPSLASTRQLQRPRQHHQEASARKAAATAQTCNPAVRSLFWRRHASIGKAIWPKAVLRGAANSCAGLRDQCPALEAMAFKGCIYHGPDQSSHPLKSYLLNSFFA